MNESRDELVSGGVKSPLPLKRQAGIGKVEESRLAWAIAGQFSLISPRFYLANKISLPSFGVDTVV